MFLNQILASKKEAVALAKRQTPLKELERQLIKEPASSAFPKSLKKDGITLIAEIKKASPSKGLLLPDFNPQSLAETYTQNGAGAISVLTEEHFFLGSLEHLKIVKNNSSLAVLRKDFIVDIYQIFESAVWRADALLLIAAILDLAQLKDYLSLAKEINLDCLVEVHSYKELEAALRAEAEIIGVNNRDLQTFNVSLQTSLDLIKEIPKDKLTVSESGIFTKEDVLKLQAAGYKGVLVGEAIVQALDRPAKIKELALL